MSLSDIATVLSAVAIIFTCLSKLVLGLVALKGAPPKHRAAILAALSLWPWR